MLDAAIPGINRLFVTGFNDDIGNIDPNQPDQPPDDDDDDDHDDDDGDDDDDDDDDRVKRNSPRKYFLPRVDIKDYNVLIDGRNFYDQNIYDDFKKYEELKKVMTGRLGLHRRIFIRL